MLLDIKTINYCQMHYKWCYNVNKIEAVYSYLLDGMVYPITIARTQATLGELFNYKSL